jgi:hypothetical protein
MAGSHKRLNLKLDVRALKSALNSMPEEFGKYPQRGEFEGSPHSEMKDIWVRYNDVEPFLKLGDFSKFGDEHDSIWYDVVNRLPIKNLLFQIMEAVDGERLGGVLITKLLPGGKIKAHTDSGWHAKYYDKYYVPVQNEIGSTFSFADGTIYPDEGDVWWFDNSIKHWVDNDTDDERIALIVCIKTENETGVNYVY